MRRATPRQRRSGTTRSTGRSRARSAAPRSTWRWSASTSCTTPRRYDVVVVDTPPTRSALELLDAPERLLRFLGHRVVRALIAPTRFTLRAASAATSAFLRGVSAVVGGELVEDAVAFFQAFAGMQEGFAERAGDVQALLVAPTTAYVLVTTPTADALGGGVVVHPAPCGARRDAERRGRQPLPSVVPRGRPRAAAHRRGRRRRPARDPRCPRACGAPRRRDAGGHHGGVRRLGGLASRAQPRARERARRPRHVAAPARRERRDAALV